VCLKNTSKRYYEAFNSIEDIPDNNWTPIWNFQNTEFRIATPEMLASTLPL